jgi:cell division protein FtsB
MDFRISQLSKIRQLPRPQFGIHNLVDHAPQAEAWADRTMEKLRPALTWVYGARRRLATGIVAVLTVWMFVHVMFGANGMVVYREKRAENQDLQRQLDSLQKENQAYNSQIQALKTDPKTIEKEAREQFHYTRKGEIVYVTPAPPPPQSTVIDRAGK